MDVDPVIPDVYVTFSNTYRTYCQYWKNGEIVNLATPNEYANTRAIFVSGNDIYVVGDASVRINIIYSPFIGQYWKNCVVSNVENGISAKSLNDVVVSEGNVYISGDGLNSMQKKLQAAYWKNGIAVPLDEANLRDSRTRGIFVAGKDVYVAGSLAYQNQTAVYWKNGAVVILGDPVITPTQPQLLYQAKTYMWLEVKGGNSHGRARYWKNGVGTFLTDSSEFNQKQLI